MYIGDQIKKLRKKRTLTQQQLADILQVGRTTVAGYENNSIQVSSDKIRMLSEALNCEVNDLFNSLLLEDEIHSKKVVPLKAPVDPTIPIDLQYTYNYLINQLHVSIKEHIQSELPDFIDRSHTHAFEVMNTIQNEYSNLDENNKALVNNAINYYILILKSQMIEGFEKLL